MEAFFGLVGLVLITGLFVAFIQESRSIEKRARRLDGTPRVPEADPSTIRGAAGVAIQRAKQSYAKGQAKAQDEASLVKYQALERLKALLDSGAISDDEFLAEKQKLLGR